MIERQIHMDSLLFNNTLKDDISLVDRALVEYLPPAKSGQADVAEAMKYSLLNGGKRIRPVMCIEFAKCLGCTTAEALPFACAIEYVHTYSLIHDDLPCMDDDDMRRGKPSCHKQFGEATALLAGDALLTHAFQIISDCDLSDFKKANAISLLAQNSGVPGMIGGQVLDLKYEETEPTLKEILTVYKLKTGALISAACLLGCIAGNATESQMAAASKYAYAIGVAFQIKDDILDVIGDSFTLGKPVGSDEKNNKTTYVSYVGLEKAKQDVVNITGRAVAELDAFPKNDFLLELSKQLIGRNK